MRQAATGPSGRGRLSYGLVWQGARYEGLVTTFLEYLGAYGGRILDGGRVVVNSAAGLRALTEMRDEIYRHGVVPPTVLTWHEEETPLRLPERRGRVHAELALRLSR